MSQTLPPGRDGLPLVGETLSFVRNPFLFIEERLAEHGRIFRLNVLGRKAVVVAGPEAAGRFIDPALVMREGSMTPHVQELFGGRSLPLLDGQVHAARKHAVMQGFTRDALAAYLPIIQDMTERYFAEWVGKPEIRWVDEFKRLALDVICTTVIGLPRGPEADRLRRDYGILSNGFATLPIEAPGTRFHKALDARDRILDVLRHCVEERRRVPTTDGLSRILASGTMTDEEAALELHHVVIAGYIVWAELAAMVQHLTAHPDVRARITGEIPPAGALTLEQLAATPYLLRVVSEVKRLCPIVPVVFGKARKDFTFDGVTVPEGWTVMWALHSSHGAQSVYSDPERFDPDRFSPERAEDKRHEHAFAPQGAGPVTGHRCPGLDLATCIMEVFAIVLLREYTWELPDQSFAMDYSKMPPEQEDGLRARVLRSSDED